MVSRGPVLITAYSVGVRRSYVVRLVRICRKFRLLNSAANLIALGVEFLGISRLRIEIGVATM
jgi:hypothetical protein